MNISTIGYDVGDPQEHHQITLDISKEDLMNLGTIYEKCFKLENKAGLHNYWDCEMFSLISLYKKMESYFEGSKYKAKPDWAEFRKSIT